MDIQLEGGQKLAKLPTPSTPLLPRLVVYIYSKLDSRDKLGVYESVIKYLNDLGKLSKTVQVNNLRHSFCKILFSEISTWIKKVSYPSIIRIRFEFLSGVSLISTKRQQNMEGSTVLVIIMSNLISLENRK